MQSYKQIASFVGINKGHLHPLSEYTVTQTAAPKAKRLCFLLFKKLPLYQLALSSFQCSRALRRSTNLNKEKQFLSPLKQEQSKIGASGTRTIELMHNMRRLSEATDTALRVVPNKR